MTNDGSTAIRWARVFLGRQRGGYGLCRRSDLPADDPVGKKALQLCAMRRTTTGTLDADAD